MKTTARVLRHTLAGRGLAFALVLGPAIAAIGAALPGGAVAAQAPDPCALLTHDEVQGLASEEQLGDGVPSAIQAFDTHTCRYTWGTGTRRFTLAVSVDPASRMFAGMSADSIKLRLLTSAVPETLDEAIQDIGEGAVFKVYSPLYVGASAYAKDRILQVNFDGFDADARKGQVIALLKSAVSRL